MANENLDAEGKPIIEDEEVDIDLDDEGKDDEGEEKKGKDGEGEGKPKKYADETPEQRSARLARMSDQHDKKHKLGKYKTATEDKPSQKKSEGMDYGQLAFLTSKGIESEDEVAFVEKTMKDTGKELKDVLKASWFQAELKEMRETNASKDAVPRGPKRSGQVTNDSVEYWLAKGELPPADQRELRQKVVNAKMKKAQSGSVFTDNPVQGNYK